MTRPRGALFVIPPCGQLFMCLSDVLVPMDLGRAALGWVPLLLLGLHQSTRGSLTTWHLAFGACEVQRRTVWTQHIAAGSCRHRCR